MSRFYLLLWLRWAIRLATCSVVLATLFSTLITAYMYIAQGMPKLDIEVVDALKDLFEFFFPLLWSFTLLLALFRSLKYIFNRCVGGYEFHLYSCDLKERLLHVGYGDLVKVWRKWFMLIIWLVASFMILSLAYTYMFKSFESIFDWFDIYWLFGFILIAGYFSFILISSRCKRIKVVKC